MRFHPFQTQRSADRVRRDTDTARGPVRRARAAVGPPVGTLLLALSATLHAASEQGNWTPLFDGESLDGWENVNGAPSTWEVRGGKLVSSGKPHSFLRTEGMYEDYVLQMQWRLASGGEGTSGVFLHADSLPRPGAPSPAAIEVQINDGDHGSIFGIRGATLKPVTNPASDGHPRARPTEQRGKPPGEWNQYTITAKDGTVSLAVNGKTVSRATDVSREKGHIALQAEHAKVAFRNIRIKRLPGDEAPPEKVARRRVGFTTLFDGQSFDGWEHPDRFDGHWIADDGVIRCDGKVPSGGARHLWTKDAFDDFVLVADWRLPAEPVRRKLTTFRPDGLFKRDDQGERVRKEILYAGDSGIFLRGHRKAQVNIWCKDPGSGDINPYHKDASLPERLRRATMPATQADNALGEWNRFVIRMTGERVSVVLNGTKVIDEAWLPGVPDGGPIGLQHHGSPLEFRNLFIKELPHRGS